MSTVKTTMSLDEVARKIEDHAEKSDEHVIAAAMLVREARQRVDSGEAGEITWYAWGLKNIKLSPSRLYELQCIAEADDPVKELERLRKLTRERVKKHRDKNASKNKEAEKSSLDSERKDLIAWAKTAPIDEVKRVLEQIASNDNVADPSKEDLSTESQNAA